MSAAADDAQLVEERIARSMQAAVYGTILTLSLVALASEYQKDPLRVMASVLATQIVFYVAHVYAGQVGVRLATHQPPTWAQLKRVALDEWPLLAAAGPPCLVLLIGGVSPLKDSTSENLALWLGVATLFLYGIRLGRAEGRTVPGIAATAVINALFGVVVVVLKVIAH
ncbi:MAG: hypothetical protein JHC95_12530 [Solirubrobacteraceae bacterium]|nr:hypothetical protein [Solirubrobacteraceae bacterium]